MNITVARILQAAALFVGTKLIEALITELTAMEEEIKKKDEGTDAIKQVVRLVHGGKK